MCGSTTRMLRMSRSATLPVISELKLRMALSFMVLGIITRRGAATIGTVTLSPGVVGGALAGLPGLAGALLLGLVGVAVAAGGRVIHQFHGGDHGIMAGMEDCMSRARKATG